MGVEEKVRQQRFDCRPITADAMVAAKLADRRMLHPIQCRLAGQRSTAGTPHPQLSDEDGQHRAVVELVVVDQALVDKSDAKPSLADQDGYPMFDLDGIDVPVHGHQGPKHCFGCRRLAVSSMATTAPEPGQRRRSSARRPHPHPVAASAHSAPDEVVVRLVIPSILAMRC
jgi:hypothetical protein